MRHEYSVLLAFLCTSFHHSSHTRLLEHSDPYSCSFLTHSFFFPLWIICFIYLCHPQSLARYESRLQTGAVVHSERCTESSRTIHCPQPFEDACIINWHSAVNVVNGHYSLKVMTRQYAFIPRKTLLSLSLASSSTRIHTSCMCIMLKSTCIYL